MTPFCLYRSCQEAGRKGHSCAAYAVIQRPLRCWNKSVDGFGTLFIFRRKSTGRNEYRAECGTHKTLRDTHFDPAPFGKNYSMALAIPRSFSQVVRRTAAKLPQKRCAPARLYISVMPSYRRAERRREHENEDEAPTGMHPGRSW